ncbi:hypothetical protein EYR36_001744 [Pleurotus pulmonarius]|nr:hypothetical protein EYR36_008315 [Pleurotus pulmonarius]KAF4579924.1 hypothetical protein EYR36_001744 [Pleurotus pulmonarius]
MPAPKTPWIRYGEANETIPIILGEDGYITSLQYFDQPSGIGVSIVSLQFKDDEGALQTIELGRLTPGRTERIRVQHIIRAEGFFNLINDGPNPVSVSGFYYADSSATDDSAPEDTNAATLSATDGVNGVGDHVQRKPAPAMARPAAGPRVNPPRQARRVSIVINGEGNEDTSGRKAPFKKVANDSDKAPRKRKAADTTDEMNDVSSAVAKPSQKQKKRKNEEPHPLRSNPIAKRRQIEAGGAPDAKHVGTAVSLQSDVSALLADSTTTQANVRSGSIANTGGLNVPKHNWLLSYTIAIRKMW